MADKLTKRIRVKAPDGRFATIPVTGLPEALKDGFVVAPQQPKSAEALQQVIPGVETLVTGKEAQTAPPSGVPRTSGEAVSRLAEAGTFGLLQEGGPALRTLIAGKGAAAARTLAPRGITPELRAAERFQVPVTKGSIRPLSLRQGIEGFIDSTILGRQAFAIFRKRLQIPKLNQAIDNFVTDVSKANLDRASAGEALQTFLKLAKKRVGDGFDKAVKEISAKAPEVAIRPGSSGLFKRAAQLRDTIRSNTNEFESLLGVADLKRALTILDDFAQEFKRVPSGLVDSGGLPVPRTIPREIPLEQAIELRKLIFAISDASETTIGKGLLKQLNKSLTQSIGESLKGKPELFNQFINASARFRIVMNQLDSQTVKAVVRSDAPENIVGIMLRKGTETRFKRIEMAFEAADIPVRKLNRIRAASLDEMFSAASREGIPISNTINNFEQKLGPRLMEKLLGGKKQMEDFRQFSKLMDALDLDVSLTKPPKGGAGAGLAVGFGASGALGAVTGMATGDVTTGLLAGLGGATGVGAVLVLPRFIAQKMTSPGGLASVNKLVQKELTSKGRQAARDRLIGFILAETEQRSRKKSLKRLELAIP
jgi:hypothetical protein